MLVDAFNSDLFTLESLTAAVNKRPHVDTALSRLFEVERISTRSAIIEAGASGLSLLDPSAIGVAAPDSAMGGLSRSAYSIASVKLGRVVNIGASDVQNVRAFGSESEAETFESVVGQKTRPVEDSINLTHEHLRLGAMKGVQLRADGVTEIFNFYNAAGITQPDVLELDFDTATRKELVEFFADLVAYMRDGAGAATPAGYVAVHGKNSFKKLVANDGVADAYDRWQEGAWLRQGAYKAPFELFGVQHIESRSPSIGADEIALAPVMPGLFKTAFTPLDNPETANTLGLPIYANPERLPFGKGYGIEVASLPIHYVTRPEVLIQASSVVSGA